MPFFMEENETKKLGRPFKMETWLPALEEVLSDEDIRFLTDEDLIFLVNRKLDPKNKIDPRTFENWKAGKFHQDADLGQQFMDCLKFAEIKQKQYLATKMLDSDEKNWQRFAWIGERKHPSLHLKSISENINRNEQQTTINITAASESQRLLIDNIINAEFEEIKPLKLEETNDKSQQDEFEF